MRTPSSDEHLPELTKVHWASGMWEQEENRVPQMQRGIIPLVLLVLFPLYIPMPCMHGTRNVMHVPDRVLWSPEQRLPICLQAAECLLICSSGLLARQHDLREWHDTMIISSSRRQHLTSPPNSSRQQHLTSAQAAAGGSIAHPDPPGSSRQQHANLT